MKKVFLVVAVLALLALGVAAQAYLMTGTYTGSGSGTLTGTPFSDSFFTITAVADTADRYVVTTDVYSIDNASASITIQNLGTYTFVTPTRMFYNNNKRTVGFSIAVFQGSDLFNIDNVLALVGWNMLTSIGPVSAQTGRLIQWGMENVNTSGGVLKFDNRSGIASTFTAQVVPEPSSLIALGVLVTPLLAFRRRKA